MKTDRSPASCLLTCQSVSTLDTDCTNDMVGIMVRRSTAKPIVIMGSPDAIIGRTRATTAMDTGSIGVCHDRDVLAITADSEAAFFVERASEASACCTQALLTATALSNCTAPALFPRSATARCNNLYPLVSANRRFDIFAPRPWLDNKEVAKFQQNHVVLLT